MWAALFSSARDRMNDNLQAYLSGQLKEYLSSGHLAGGGQAAVIRAGEIVADVTVGVDHADQARTPDSVACLYCISKVPVAMALLALADRGQLSLDRPVGEVLPDANPFIASCPIDLLMAHRGGVAIFQGPVSRFVPDPMRRVSHTWLSESPDSPRGSLRYAVSETAWVMAAIVERITGQHYAEATRSLLDSAFVPGAIRPQTGPLAITYRKLEPDDPPIPVLNEQVAAVRDQWNPALGWYASAGSLAFFGHSLSEAWNGRCSISADLVKRATAPFAEAEFDPGLKRDASHGLGVWTELNRFHSISSKLSASSFGHGAQGGASYLIVDPERELSIGLSFDLSLDEDVNESKRRAPLVEGILEILDA